MSTKLRHWKQRYQRGAVLIWRRDMLFDGRRVRPGEQVPDSVAESKRRRLWEAGFVELRDHPTRLIPLAESSSTTKSLRRSRRESKRAAQG